MLEETEVINASKCLAEAALQEEAIRISEKADQLFKDDVIMHTRLIEGLEKQLADAKEVLAKMDIDEYIEREKVRARNVPAFRGGVISGTSFMNSFPVTFTAKY